MPYFLAECTEFGSQRLIVDDVDIVHGLMRKRWFDWRDNAMCRGVDSRRIHCGVLWFIICGAVDKPWILKMEHLPMDAVGKEIGDMLGKDIGAGPVVFPPAGIVHDEFAWSERLAHMVQVDDLLMMP